MVVSSLNINKSTQIKLLTWTSPKISLGIITALASTSAASLAVGTTLLLNNKKLTLSRKVHINHNERFRQDFGGIKDNRDDFEETEFEHDFNSNDLDVAPERNLRDPIPTVTVPFRIINRNNVKKSSSDPIEEENLNEDIGRFDTDRYPEDRDCLDKEISSDYDNIGNTKSDPDELIDDWNDDYNEKW